MGDITRVLVFGATGTQGGPVARRLLQAGIAVRALVRDPDRAQALGAAGAELVVGDQDDRASLEAASKGVDAAFVMASASMPATAYERHIVNSLTAASDAGVGHVVLATSGMVPREPSGAPVLDTKRAVVTAAASLVPGAVVLTATLYSENLLLAVDAVRNGLLPQPIPAAVPVAWLSLDDHAAAAAAALTRPDLAGRRFDLGGPDAVTGPDLAERVAAATGRPVTYLATTPVDFGRQVEPFLGPDIAAQLVAAYEYEGTAGAAALTPDPVGWADLGVRPTPLDSWIGATLAPVLG